MTDDRLSHGSVDQMRGPDFTLGGTHETMARLIRWQIWTANELAHLQEQC